MDSLINSVLGNLEQSAIFRSSEVVVAALLKRKPLDSLSKAVELEAEMFIARTATFNNHAYPKMFTRVHLLVKQSLLECSFSKYLQQQKAEAKKTRAILNSFHRSGGKVT